MTIYNTISQLLPTGLTLPNEPMSRHTSFKIGGPAEVYAMPETTSQLQQIWQACLKNNWPVTVLGGGCNVLVSDAGIKGVVIATGNMKQIHIDHDAQTITAGSGTRLGTLAEAACKAGLSGLEFASGIPGTVGGAVYMNAGAYGHEIKDVCEAVQALLPTGETPLYERAQLGLAYRTSRFQSTNEIITAATFRLTPKNPEEIRAYTTELNNRRKQSQPLDYPSAGSAFKRPAIQGVYAARLIDDHGLKGLTIGGAQVSEKHAGFIINKAGATANDVTNLIAKIQETIQAKSGIKLEPEVQLLGF